MKISERTKRHFKKAKRFIVAHSNSLILSIGSLLYGVQLVRYPHILATYSIYQSIVELINYRYVGLIFIVLGLLKLIGLLFNWQRLRRISLVAFTYVWCFFSLSFVLSQPPNSIWVFALIMTALSISISFRGDFSE